MRNGRRRLPLVALGALGVLIAILAGIYIYRESTSGVLVDQSGSGPGGETTEVFTVNGAWDLRWSYECSSNLDPCDFFITVKQLTDCAVSVENHGITEYGAKDHGLIHYHTGGTFYFVVFISPHPYIPDVTPSWTVTVSGSGRASGVGPAPHCSEG
jgi:hypothetical protein